MLNVLQYFFVKVIMDAIFVLQENKRVNLKVSFVCLMYRHNYIF